MIGYHRHGIACIARKFQHNCRTRPKNKNNLKGKNAEYNAQQIINIYRGEDNEFSDAVALNAAAGLVVVKKEKDFKNSYNSAKQHLKSGKVFDHLQKIQAI